jgi:hypothetical protein
MAAAAANLVAGIMTLLFYGALPLGLVLRRACAVRRRRPLGDAVDQEPHGSDRSDSEGNQ